MNTSRPASPSGTPLASTSLEVTITDLVAEYGVSHHFRNDGTEAIEAVFSFPVPLDAAFLGLSATLAGETQEAQIQPRSKATRTYDDALAEGHSAVLMSTPEPGLLCLSLEHLKPGESGEINLRFAAALRVADCTARFSLPLVHRPRYGTWRLEELETPTHDFALEHPMSATIHVLGLLASAPVHCATHAARFVRHGEVLELSIGRALLDRDLVLSFELGQSLAPTCHLIEDGEASLGLVSFVLPARAQSPRPLDLCLLLDGSGSMSGDAIEQSRRAMTAVIDALGEHDLVQVARFGSAVVPLFRRPLRATAHVREALRELALTIHADLGGTEMGIALSRALQQLGPVQSDRSRAIILVTDGAAQPSALTSAQTAALHAGVRIFVVAVGSSAGAEVLEPLAEATGAVLERAIPAEPIDVCVMRQFRRAREAGTVDLHVSWSGISWMGQSAVPVSMGMAYPGDAVSVCARLPKSARGKVHVEASSLAFSISLPFGRRTSAPALRALIGQQIHRSADPAEREALAVHFGLLTRETAAVLVKLRENKGMAGALPTIAPIPQMTAEGMLAGAAHTAKGTSLSDDERKFLDPDRVYDDSELIMESHDPGIGGLDESVGAVDSDDELSPAETEPAFDPSTLTPEFRRQIFQALHDVLLDLMTTAPVGSVKLEAAIKALPEELREGAMGLLTAFLIQERRTSGDRVACFVLDMTHTLLRKPTLSDDQEATLALAHIRMTIAT